ncbi:hypothetical protein DSO57_1004768 [Entomophthora muscae]|uniref:Uncharacterized protein n=2 Tax=Entomophthora muscae TaxID=34485 RepID=A0ACC2UHR9_9FUNG|nr:hypothetical protein DSO57_1000544 [Entomophthora muscae]KAJ9086375.1 hypothetical protein DSO57_1004768 [Entomophthora muscae]
MSIVMFPGHLLSPPETFGIVEKGVYRSEALKTSHFQFLKPLQLRTLLVLSREPLSKPVSSFLIENKIRLVQLRPDVPKSGMTWKPTSEEQVKEGLELLLDKANHPILVTCTTGLHETSAFIGCLRRLQNWNFNSIIVEYRAYAKSKARSLVEHFIELFDTDFVNLPSNLPEWF